jgi:hypothetical protein
MLSQFLANLTLIIHLLFIVFVVFGAFLVIKWNLLILLHIPCVIWGALLEINQWICPLTYIENHFRYLSGKAGYTGGFIEYYLLPVVYPAGLTPDIQIVLGIFILFTNLLIYGFIIFSWHKTKRKTT